MKVVYNIISLGIGFILLGSCTNNYSGKQCSPSEYKNWIKEHHQHWQETVDDIQISLNYIPGEYKFLLDFRKDYNSASEETRKAYHTKRFFKLDISSEYNNGDMISYRAGSQSETSGRLEYVMSGLKNDLYIYNQQDTVYCQDVHYERNYGLNNKMSLMLTFPNHTMFNHSDLAKFVYRDKLFNLGPITFSLDAKELNNTPQLKL